MLYEFINKLENLVQQAKNNYKAIEDFYRVGPNGKIVRSPMNVVAYYKGDSIHSSHNNAFNVAASYMDLCGEETILGQTNMLQELLEFFNEANSKSNPIDPQLPEEFMDSMDDFHHDLSELCAKFSAMTQTTQNALGIEKRELFGQQISILVSKDYDPELVENAFRMVTKKKQETVPVFSFLKLLELQMEFSKTVVSPVRKRALRYLDVSEKKPEVLNENQGLATVTSDKSISLEKSQRLANYLQTLADMLLIDEFLATFNELHYQKSLNEAISLKTFGKKDFAFWDRDGFTTPAETKVREEHRKKYKLVCDEIPNKCSSQVSFFVAANTQEIEYKKEFYAVCDEEGFSL